MTAEPVEQAGPVTFHANEARRLVALAGQLMRAATPLLNGARQLDHEDLEAMKQAALRITAITFEADFRPADVIDLDAERHRRRAS